MSDRLTKVTASLGLFIGGVFGMIGSFVPSAPLRSLAWGIDGVGLILATVILAVYYFRKELDVTAAGFLIFAIGESLIISSSGIRLDANASSFGAGCSLWATSLFVISSQKTFLMFIRCTGFLAAVLFAVVAVQIFMDYPLNALTKPLPFFTYPIFVITIFGWVWTLLREHPRLTN